MIFFNCVLLQFYSTMTNLGKSPKQNVVFCHTTDGKKIMFVATTHHVVVTAHHVVVTACHAVTWISTLSFGPCCFILKTVDLSGSSTVSAVNTNPCSISGFLVTAETTVTGVTTVTTETTGGSL